MFLHRGWACNNIGSFVFENFKCFGESIFIKVVNLIDLVNRNKFTLIQFHVASSMAIQERRKHANNNVSKSMACSVKHTNFKFKFLNIIIFSIISKIL